MCAVAVPCLGKTCLAICVFLWNRSFVQCILCSNHSSSSKFDSGTGWPSFHSALKMSSDEKMPPQLTVVEKSDTSHGMVRVEVLCCKVNFMCSLFPSHFSRS